MNREFHYYAMYYLCRSAGCNEDESLIIATASQLVDDCRSPWSIAGQREIERETLTEVTQNYLFWDQDIGARIYIPFHFLPGGATGAATCIVIPDSNLARTVLIEALRSNDPYRIGIACHAYADTWAHQGFSGLLDQQNAFPQQNLVPAVGHLHAGVMPDNPRLTWKDPRLPAGSSIISNPARCLAAARMLYRFLCTWKRRAFTDESFVLDPLERIWTGGYAGKTDEQAIASDYVIYLDVPMYDSNAWLREVGARRSAAPSAIVDADRFDPVAWVRSTLGSFALHEPQGVIDGRRYEGSRLQAWNRAARLHRETVHRYLCTKGNPECLHQ
ncbi:MAG: hypothetical protein QHH01_06545 [Spirochaetales bacterium]|nr:hypothetical protein [Spirochaetales bacterium]